MKKLYECVLDNDFLALKKLIKNGTDLNTTLDCEDGDNVFFLALKYDCDFDTLKLLIENNLNLNYINNEGVGILDEAVLSGDLELVKYLVEEKKLDPSVTKRKSGFTPLMQAASYGYLELIKYFISYGVDIEQKDNSGCSAKDYSRKLGQGAIVKYFNSLEN